MSLQKRINQEIRLNELLHFRRWLDECVTDSEDPKKVVHLGLIKQYLEGRKKESNAEK